MITFKDFLIESKSAPLYHGTTMFNVFNILRKGFIEPRTIQALGVDTKDVNLKRGISTSRNYRFSLYWAMNKSYGDFPAIIHLDQRKIANDFRITPYQYWRTKTRNQEHSGHSSSNEYEEFIIIPQGKSLDVKKYVTQIDYGGSLDDYSDYYDLRNKYHKIKFKKI